MLQGLKENENFAEWLEEWVAKINRSHMSGLHQIRQKKTARQGDRRGRFTRAKPANNKAKGILFCPKKRH